MFRYHGFLGPCPKPPLPKPRSEIERLRAEIAALIAQLDDTHARMNDLRKDAERYRWVRDNWGRITTYTNWIGDTRIVERIWIAMQFANLDPKSVTAAIDAAMANDSEPVQKEPAGE
jgi:hypothetical protein